MGELSGPDVAVLDGRALWSAQRLCELRVPGGRHPALDALRARDVAILHLIKPCILKEHMLIRDDQEGCQGLHKDVGSSLADPVGSVRNLHRPDPGGHNESVVCGGCIAGILLERHKGRAGFLDRQS